MNAERLGRLARMLRVRQRLTQVTLAARAGVSRRAVSMLERGLCRQLSLERVEAIVNALGGRIDLRLLWNGPELDRLADGGHAALGALVKQRLERWGWLVKVEVSYSEWGERGRIDLLAFHPATHILLVIELKTELVDVQSLLGSLDAKTRLARSIASRFGWGGRLGRSGRGFRGGPHHPKSACEARWTVRPIRGPWQEGVRLAPTAGQGQ